jgi:hypothetical protein
MVIVRNVSLGTMENHRLLKSQSRHRFPDGAFFINCLSFSVSFSFSFSFSLTFTFTFSFVLIHVRSTLSLPLVSVSKHFHSNHAFPNWRSLIPAVDSGPRHHHWQKLIGYFVAVMWMLLDHERRLVKDTFPIRDFKEISLNIFDLNNMVADKPHHRNNKRS